MNWILILVQVISWAIFLFFILPMILFLVYLFSDLYNKLYLRLVGQGNKWYQNLFIFGAGLLTLGKRRYIEKNLKQGDINHHIAIVLANNYFPENIFGFGLHNEVRLIKYLKKNNKSYVIYNKVTSNQLRKIINDKRVNSIFLFGHGERHGIKVGRNEAVYYCEFPNHPKKHLIAQFHCNHLKGRALSEYGEKPVFVFIKNKLQRHSDIEKQISEIIKKEII